MTDPIVKVSTSGQSALTTDQKDLVFDIDNDYMIILDERTDQSDGSNDLEITHNLGYIPSFYTFLKTSGVWHRQLQSGLGGSYADTSKIYIKTDSANQYVRTVIWANSQDNSVGSGRNNASGKLRVSKFGYDAEKETDLRRFKFASGGGVFKIKEKKTFTVIVSTPDGSGNTDDSFQYAHGLGYTPQVYVLLYDTTGIQIPAFFLIAAGVSIVFDYDIDDTYLTVKVQSSGYAFSGGEEIKFIAQILLDKIE